MMMKGFGGLDVKQIIAVINSVWRQDYYFRVQTLFLREINKNTFNWETISSSYGTEYAL